MKKRAVGAPAAKKAKAAPKKSTKQKRGGAAVAARRAHNPKVAGSTPAPATNKPAAKKAAKPTKAEAAATVGKLLEAPGAPDPSQELTPTQVGFANEYLKDLNGTAAYRRIHPTAAVSTCATESWRILRNPKVRAFIEAERQKLSERFGYTKEDLVADLVAIVKADPAELTRMRHISCDACWGGVTKEVPHGLWADPDPDCLQCQGQGIPRPWFADTTKLSPAARALFQSVEVTKTGIKVHMESKSEAREKLAKILGAYELDNKQKTDPLMELLNSMGRSAMPVVKEPSRNG